MARPRRRANQEEFPAILTFTESLEAARARLESLEARYRELGQEALAIDAERTSLKARITRLERWGRPRRGGS